MKSAVSAPTGAVHTFYDLVVPVVMWPFGDDFSQHRIDMVYPEVLKNYVLSAVISAMPILAANWSRGTWPRIALAVLSLIAEVMAGTVLILIPGHVD